MKFKKYLNENQYIMAQDSYFRLGNYGINVKNNVVIDLMSIERDLNVADVVYEKLEENPIKYKLWIDNSRNNNISQSYFKDISRQITRKLLSAGWYYVDTEMNTSTIDNVNSELILMSDFKHLIYFNPYTCEITVLPK